MANMDLSTERLLVVAPHPDDEVFGCGGLMHRIKSAGGEVYVLYMTVGVTQDFSKNKESTPDERLKEIEAVAGVMSIDGHRMALPGNDYHLQLDVVPQKQLIHEIERGEHISLEAVKPTILAIPSQYDYNQDHRAVNAAAITATRPVPPVFKHLQPVVLEYEFPYSPWTSSMVHPTPNMFVQLDTEALEAKITALRLYASQLKVERGPLSVHGVETLARMRGIESGHDAAEAYVARRILW